MIQGLIVSPFGGIAALIIGQIFLPLWICIILGIGAAAYLVKTTILDEDISFELDDNGGFRYFIRKNLKNTYELSKYSIGYHRKTQWGILGNNNIRLKFLSDQGEESEIDAGPLGTTQFNEMFEAMENFSIKSEETLIANKKKEH
jgi:hypothetical protein